MASRNSLDKARRQRSYPEARIALLKEKGRSLAQIAAELGVDRSLVAHVNALRRRESRLAKRTREAIAKALGMSVREAFPDIEERVA